MMADDAAGLAPHEAVWVEYARAAEQRGDGQCNGTRGDVCEGRKAPVVDLLSAAGLWEVNYADGGGVVKVAAWVIECDVAVFAYAQHDHVDGARIEEIGVAGRLGLGISGAAVNDARCAADTRPERQAQVFSKALGSV